MILAFKPDWTRFYHWYLHRKDTRPRLFQRCAFEFVDVVGEVLCCGVDGGAEGVGGELPAEVAGGFGVVDCVFAVVAGGALGGGVGGWGVVCGALGVGGRVYRGWWEGLV